MNKNENMAKALKVRLFWTDESRCENRLADIGFAGRMSAFGGKADMPFYTAYVR